MEWENKKRGREEEGGGGGEKKEKFVKRSAAAKEERSGHVEVEADHQSSHISSSSDKYLGLGVFDFPWLHDDDDGGIISKSEQDWNLFQDTFSSLLHDTEFTTHCNLFETTDAAANTPTTTTMNINTNTNVNINIPDYKFEGAFPFKGEEEDDDHDDDLEIGNVDGSIWSSMFNQPLQHPHTH